MKVYNLAQALHRKFDGLDGALAGRTQAVRANTGFIKYGGHWWGPFGEYVATVSLGNRNVNTYFEVGTQRTKIGSPGLSRRS